MSRAVLLVALVLGAWLGAASLGGGEPGGRSPGDPATAPADSPAGNPAIAPAAGDAAEQAAPAAGGATSGPSPAESDAGDKDARDEGEDDDDDKDDEDGGVFIDPMGPNAACYVCHQTFIFEEISAVHKAEKITCIKCHGLSAAHANDEHVGATPPDVRYPRDKIDAACAECHEDHDVPAAEVLARFVERKLTPRPTPVCTDCHGRHRIPEAAAGALLPGGS